MKVKKVAISNLLFDIEMHACIRKFVDITANKPTTKNKKKKNENIK